MTTPRKPRKKREHRYNVRLTLDEINALLATSGNADAPAMAEEYENEAEGQKFLDDLASATAKLHEAR